MFKFVIFDLDGTLVDSVNQNAQTWQETFWKLGKAYAEKNIDLHGSAPDKHKSALLLIDVINDLDFPKADQLLKYARPMTRNLLRLKRRAQKFRLK